LLAHSIDGVGEVYQRLKNILDTTAAQQVESSLQNQVEASILPPACPKDEGQRDAQGALDMGMASPSARFLTSDCLNRPSTRSEPHIY
jgi:hypothetical protein